MSIDLKDCKFCANNDCELDDCCDYHNDCHDNDCCIDNWDTDLGIL